MSWQLALELPEQAQRPQQVALAEGAVLLRGFAFPVEQALLSGIAEVIASAPLRHMSTPGGFRMSVAMTNCGTLGWVSDRNGYRYTERDGEHGVPWPAMPVVFSQLATAAASRSGFAAFAPDACLINRYEPGTRLTLHQDKNERGFSAPIVSVSLGIPAVFLFGGERRSQRPQRVPLSHCDVVVWGGPARLHYHGVLPLRPAQHPTLGGCRINLTFRSAG